MCVRVKKYSKENTIDNIDRLHTTEMGVDRIRRNPGFGEIDVVAWCKKKILNEDAEIERRGKNWHVHI